MSRNKQPKRYILIPVEQKKIHDKDIQDLSEKASQLKKKIEKNNVYTAKIIWADDNNINSMLKSLKAENGDRLYISAHGDDESIGTMSDKVNISPKALSVLLKSKNLPENFKDIRVFACHSAESYDAVSKEFTEPSEDQEMKTYAGKLAEEMANKGYSHVIVSGYMGGIQYIEAPHKPIKGPYLGHDADEQAYADLFMDNGEKVKPSRGRLRLFSDISKHDEKEVKKIKDENKENISRRKKQFRSKD